MSVYSNIVEKDKLRKIQSEVLEVIKNALIKSYGPYGSNTLIYNDSTLNKYSKDGHQILSSIKIANEIEASVQRDLVEITNNTVRKMGDGTTAAVILSSIIFEKFQNLNEEFTPYTLMRLFDETVKLISEEILKNKREFNADMAYQIAMISTNGNKNISNEIAEIYRKYGNDVYIDVTVTSQDKNVIKVYDGLSMKEGLYSSAYMNRPEENKADLRNAYIYYFDDPVDTPEMMALFNAIIQNNLFNKSKEVKPTVILTPHISRDMSTYIEQVEGIMNNCRGMAKPPLMIINNIFRNGNIDDIVKMCGCRPIKKYIDFKQQNEDIERGLAPTTETVSDFGGFADQVVATTTETKFINPKNMVVKDENGIVTSYSLEYENLVEYVKNELNRSIDDGEDANKIGGLRRRLNALKANMVEYVIGGITLADREALKCLVEDAVLNCRSASEHGVGWGANFEGLRASRIVKDNLHKRDNRYPIAVTIYKSYKELIKILYGTMFMKDNMIEEIMKEEEPFNMVTKAFDGKVVSSIMLDVVILDSISKLLTLLLTCNQFILSDPLKNIYSNPNMYK